MRRASQLASVRTAAVGAAMLLALSVLGCKPRENGVAFSNTQAKSVDPSWVAAAKSCWPDLAHVQLSNEAITRNLADPLHFRSTFGAYASLSDAQIEAIVARPILDAPEPSHTPMLGSRTPVLTRAQAAAGVRPPQSAPAPGGLPDDVLCSLQSGTPVGFK
jgi:hypothetical protein